MFNSYKIYLHIKFQLCSTIGLFCSSLKRTCDSIQQLDDAVWVWEARPEEITHGTGIPIQADVLDDAASSGIPQLWLKIYKWNYKFFCIDIHLMASII